MEDMGDRFLEGKQKENKRSVFSTEFFLAVLLVVSTFVLLNGGAFSWVGLFGFAGAILIALIISLRGG